MMSHYDATTDLHKVINLDPKLNPLVRRKNIWKLQKTASRPRLLCGLMMPVGIKGTKRAVDSRGEKGRAHRGPEGGGGGRGRGGKRSPPEEEILLTQGSSSHLMLC